MPSLVFACGHVDIAALFMRISSLCSFSLYLRQENNINHLFHTKTIHSLFNKFSYRFHRTKIALQTMNIYIFCILNYIIGDFLAFFHISTSNINMRITFCQFTSCFNAYSAGRTRYDDTFISCKNRNFIFLTAKKGLSKTSKIQ